MKITFFPKSKLGWLSFCLVIVSFLLFILFSIILGPGPDYNMFLAYSLTVVISCIVAIALVTGLASIIKNKEWSILVLIAILISLYTLFGTVTSLIGLQS